LRHASDIVGREIERKELRRVVAQVHHGRGNVVLVQGEAGIGKSRLLSDLVDEAQASDVRILQGFASAIDRATPYFVWRNVLLEVLGADSVGHASRTADALYKKFGSDDRLVSWLPLLNDIIPVGIVDTDLTKRITGSARAASIERLIVALLDDSEQGPTLLVFEDMHWFDHASLSLLTAVARLLPQLLIVVSMRPIDPSATTPSRKAELGPALEMRLGPLPHDAVAELIRQRLRAVEVPNVLVSFVHRRTGGNPFYCEELVLALRDTGAIALTRGTCRILTDLTDASNTTLSVGLEGAIVSRVDSLPVDGQLLLKVASAFGGTFTAETLQSVYPRPITQAEVIATLKLLIEHEVLHIHDQGPIPGYAFRHAISQEVTYNLLSFAQRRTLHRTIAATLESLHVGRLEPLYAQLAQHWERADERAHAIRYLEFAAEQALRNYANHDAIRYIGKALHWVEDSLVEAEEWRLSRWEVILGDAYNELADYDEAPSHYARAMVLLGQRLPKRTIDRIGSLLKNSILQGYFRLVPPRPEKLTALARQRLERAAHIRERLSERHFFRNESLALLDETLAALNLAERCGAIAETISGYNALALGLAISGLLAPARFYSRRALRLAQEKGGLPDAARAYLVAAVLGYGLGEWDFTERYAGRAMALLQQLGDRSRWHAPLTILIFAAILRGDLLQADKLLIEFAASMSAESSNQAQAWYLAAKVLCNLLRGKTEPAELNRLRGLAEAKQVRADQLLCLGIVASAYLQRQDMSNALEAAESGLAVLRESSAVWASYVYGVAGVIEVLVARWALGPKSRNSHVKAKALVACKLAARVTRTSPVCRPHTLLMRGRTSFLSGQLGKARRHWQRAALVAERLQMRREVGLALYEIGRTTASSDPGRLLNLARAADIFEMLGADADLANARRAMSA
jgi:adenylate cyclase